MKIMVCHWMGSKPPHRDAVEENGEFFLELNNLDDVTELVKEYDVMFSTRHGSLILFLDNKNRYFRQR